jgi:glycosyltransferase involved in cell wall biosynthesis
MPISKLVGVIVVSLSNEDIKIIFHEHGSIYRGWLIYNIFIRVSDNWVDRHISVSNKGKELLKERGVRDEKISVIRNFADIARYEKDKIKEFRPEQGQCSEESYFRVGYAGRITSWKGWEDFVECFDYIEQVKFLIAGDGDEVRLLKDAISPEKHIHHLGYVDDIRQLFSRIDCLVIPSHWDPNPLIFYESLASRTPVVASRCDSLKEITNNRKNCLEIEPENPKDIAEKIEEMRDNNELRQKIIENGFCFAKSNRKSKFIDEVRDFYSQQGI